MKLSGFSFIHNALTGGYPIAEAIETIQPYVDEVVVIDMESTDGTRDLLRRLGVRIIDGKWGNQAGQTLAEAHALHWHCEGEVIVHFEGDEVFDEGLLWEITDRVSHGQTDLAVYRLQVSQNFQRVRWYPDPVHRVFPKASVVKRGHTTDRHHQAEIINPAHGFLWDCTNCFRDNWIQRVEQQAELWHGKRQYIMTPLHILHEAEIDEAKARELLKAPHWTWTETPLKIPEILKPLVGRTKYEPA